MRAIGAVMVVIFTTNVSSALNISYRELEKAVTRRSTDEKNYTAYSNDYLFFVRIS